MKLRGMEVSGLRRVVFNTSTHNTLWIKSDQDYKWYSRHGQGVKTQEEMIRAIRYHDVAKTRIWFEGDTLNIMVEEKVRDLVICLL